jgi:uncharacterized protein
MKILIAGGSGFLGNSLLQSFQDNGWEVSLLTRKKGMVSNIQSFYWNPVENYIDPAAFHNQDVIINLAGEPISNGLWTRKKKKMILESRIQSTRLLIEEIKKNHTRKPIKFISASAIGYYGSQTGKKLTESSLAGSGFLSFVCSEWEKEAKKLEENNLSLSIVRIGIVLSEKGGFLLQMKKMLKSGINLVAGDGNQSMSWIQIEDLNRIFQFLITKENIEGVYNCVSPTPCKLYNFQALLFKVSNRKSITIKIPARILKMLLGEFSELFLSDQNCIPERLIESGFQFNHTDLEKVLLDFNL